MTDKPITLPEPAYPKGSECTIKEGAIDDFYTADQVRAAVLADRALNATAQGMAEFITCERCGHETWIMEGKAPCQITESDKRAAAPTAPVPAVDAVAGEPVAKPKPPGHVDLGSLKVNYPSAEWMARAEEYVKRVSGRMQEAIDAAAEHGRDDYRVQQASAGAWLAATDLRSMAIERGIELMPPRAGSETTASASVQGVMGAEVVTDAARYRKLRRWMSSNVTEGWTQVEQLAAIACYVDWSAFDEALDALPECTHGLCATPAAPSQGAKQANETSEQIYESITGRKP